MTRLVCFVGGIHGVGKTAFCSEAANALGVVHITASQLISQHSSKLADKTKLVDSVTNNQELLIQAFEQYDGGHHGILMDGHFCLLGHDLSIREIPGAVFGRLGIRAVVVLTCNPATIHKRLQARDNRSYDIELLGAFQQREVSHAQNISSLLNIPILVFDESSHISDAVTFLGFHFPSHAQ